MYHPFLPGVAILKVNNSGTETPSSFAIASAIEIDVLTFPFSIR